MARSRGAKWTGIEAEGKVKKKRAAPKAPARATRVNERASRTTGRSAEDEFWRMRLYVAGQSPRSAAAIKNLRAICHTHLPGRYEVEIVDLMRHPEQAKADQIVAIPTAGQEGSRCRSGTLSVTFPQPSAC